MVKLTHLEKIALDYANAEIIDFGKVFFIPAMLPDMNLIVFKKGDIFQAICIDIELDAVGNSLKDACENLRNTLISYVKQMISNYDDNKKAAIEDIVKTAFSEGSIKSLLFSRYLQAKRERIITKITQENKLKAKKDYLVLFLKILFTFRSVKFNLAMAGVIA